MTNADMDHLPSYNEVLLGIRESSLDAVGPDYQQMWQARRQRTTDTTDSRGDEETHSGTTRSGNDEVLPVEYEMIWHELMTTIDADELPSYDDVIGDTVRDSGCYGEEDEPIEPPPSYQVVTIGRRVSYT